MQVSGQACPIGLLPSDSLEDPFEHSEAGQIVQRLYAGFVQGRDEVKTGILGFLIPKCLLNINIFFIRVESQSCPFC